MDRPRIFISAVSEELRKARQTVARIIRTLGFDAISQDDFPSGHGELGQWLRSQLDSCVGLIQLVGQGYGIEPREVDEVYGRVSYTQFEFLYARNRKLKTWVVLIEHSFGSDISSDQLDLPRDSESPDPIAYQSERRKLQKSYIDRLKKDNHVRYSVKNNDVLENFVLRLRDDLGGLRQRAEQKRRYIIYVVFAVLALLGVSGWFGYQSLHTDIVSEVNAAKIRAHLLRTIEETYRGELAQADAILDWKERQRLREAATTAHTAQMSRIDEIVASFTEIEGDGTSTTVSHELARVLSEAGVDQAIEYIGTKRAAILENIRGRSAMTHDRNRIELQPLLRVAALHKAKGEVAQARAIYDEILEIEPEWPQALHAIFWFLVNQGEIAQRRTTLEDARHYYEDAHQRAQLLVKVDQQNNESQRDHSISVGGFKFQVQRVNDGAIARRLPGAWQS